MEGARLICFELVDHQVNTNFRLVEGQMSSNHCRLIRTGESERHDNRVVVSMSESITSI